MSTAISVRNLSKRYRIGLEEKQHDTFAAQLGALLRSPFSNLRQLRNLSRFKEEDDSVFWALRDIEFEVKEGEVLGIIGHNGAGKSTLLKVLSRITEPTTGEIKIRGKVSSLLEVGTGFHQDLTGRENIYMNGTILGMRKKEIDSKLDEIIEFSGVKKYIDTPVKRYSSGMKVRLAFSVAAHLEPEVLVIDEVLAVGDTEFQSKCLGKMGEFAGQGRTVLFVSHNMAAVSNLCMRSIVLEKGCVVYDGEVEMGIKKYLQKSIVEFEDNHNKNFFKGLSFFSDGIESDIVLNGVNLSIIANFFCDEEHSNLIVKMQIIDQFEEVIATLNSHIKGRSLMFNKGDNGLEFYLPNNQLTSGEYRIRLTVRDREKNELLTYISKALTVQNGDFYGTGKIPSLTNAGKVLLPFEIRQK